MFNKCDELIKESFLLSFQLQVLILGLLLILLVFIFSLLISNKTIKVKIASIMSLSLIFIFVSCVYQSLSSDTPIFKKFNKWKDLENKQTLEQKLKNPTCAIQYYTIGDISFEDLLHSQNDNTGEIDFFLYQTYKTGTSSIFKNEKLAKSYLESSANKNFKEAKIIYLDEKYKTISLKEFNKALKDGEFDQDLICFFVEKFYKQDQKTLADDLAKEHKCFKEWNKYH